MHPTGLGDSPLHSHLAHRDYLSNLIQTKSHAVVKNRFVPWDAEYCEDNYSAVSSLLYKLP